MLLWLNNPLKLLIGLPFLKVSSLVKIHPLPKPWTVKPLPEECYISWMMSSLFWKSVDRSWGVSFLLWWNLVVSSLSLLGSFIGRFGLHGCSILLWTFPSTSSYALKQSGSNPSPLHLIRGPIYIPLFLGYNSQLWFQFVLSWVYYWPMGPPRSLWAHAYLVWASFAFKFSVSTVYIKEWSKLRICLITLPY